MRGQDRSTVECDKGAEMEMKMLVHVFIGVTMRSGGQSSHTKSGFPWV